MNQGSNKHFDKVILLFLFALFLLVSPVIHLWATDSFKWYAPYLIWLLIIIMAFLLQRQLDRS